MTGITYIETRDLELYPQLRRVVKLETPADVATLLATYMEVRSLPTVDFRAIEDVYEENRCYVFTIARTPTSFDILEFINDKYKSNVNITGQNAGYLFPKNRARTQIGIEMRGQGRYGGRGESSTNDNPCGFYDSKARKEVRISERYTRHNPFIVGRSNDTSMGYTIKEQVPKGMPPSLGRKHCIFYYDRGDLYLEDNDSKNGTFVNGSKQIPNREIRLRKGDRVRLANYEIEVI